MENSIALAFVDQGAAAYAGFAYSPNEGYLIGEFDGAPFRYTWPGFPIGHAVQVQNRGTLKGFAQFPYYYLLGDPRISLQDEPPYRLDEDREEAGGRRLRYVDAPAGIIPLRIAGGARYSYVRIPGVTSSWESEPFYNSRLQMADFGDDKYILFEHPGGAFEVLLSERPPWYWLVLDLLLDSLDHTLVYLPQTGGDIVALFTGGVAWLALVRLLRRNGRDRLYLLASVSTGAFLACVHGVYVLVRLPELTITSKMVELSLSALVGTFLVTSPVSRHSVLAPQDVGGDCGHSSHLGQHSFQLGAGGPGQRLRLQVGSRDWHLQSCSGDMARGRPPSGDRGSPGVLRRTTKAGGKSPPGRSSSGSSGGKLRA
jgi:hypothetical protein